MGKKNWKSAIEEGRIEIAAHQAVDDLRIQGSRGQFFNWKEFDRIVGDRLRSLEEEKLDKLLYDRFWADVERLKITAKKIAQKMLKEAEE